MNNRLYVGNLSFHTTEDSVTRTFAQVGDVVETKLVIDRETGRSRGFAFVVMSSEDGARKAISELDGADLDGRPLRVNEAEQRKPRTGGGGFGDRPSGGGGDRGGFRGGADRSRNRW